MLDIKFIRDNQDLIKEAIRKKKVELNLDQFLELDQKRRQLQQTVDELRSTHNQASDRISQTTDPDLRQRLIDQTQTGKTELQNQEEKLKQITKDWQALMLKIPNLPDMTVPEGDGEDDNQPLKEWGNKPQFSFQAKDHIELMTTNKMVDFDRGVKVHGFRGYFLINDGALLAQAIWNYGRDFFLKKNFQYVIAPSVVKKEYLYGTGHLPNDAEDLFETQDQDYLSGTAEIPLMAYHAQETLKKEDLPKRYLAFSPCYRREAGSHGRDTKGLMRVHEFYKLEQLILCPADHQISVKLHEELNRNHEEFMESLNLPYRQTVICTGDLKAAQVKCYDTELWIPSLQSYREIGSASYYHDFQARRFGIRYQDGDTKRYVHSLNATAVPTPRILIALVENYQQADGSIKIPTVLQPYMNNRELISNN